MVYWALLHTTVAHLKWKRLSSLDRGTRFPFSRNVLSYCSHSYTSDITTVTETHFGIDLQKKNFTSYFQPTDLTLRLWRQCKSFTAGARDKEVKEFRHNMPVPLSHNGNDIGLCILVVVNVQNPSTAHPRRVKPFMQGGQQQQRSACFYSAFPSEQAVNRCPDPPYLGACLPATLAWSRDKGISPPLPPSHPPPHPPPPKNKQKSETEKKDTQMHK